MSRITLTATLIFGCLAPSYAATIQEAYELQERCGKQADAEFKKEFGNGVINTKEGQALAGYRNHYNTKLNKCFYLLTYRDLPYKKNKAASTLITLFDINENKEYGNFFKSDSASQPFQCTVSGKDCNSEKEWDALVSTYMDQ